MWIPINESWGVPNLHDARQRDHLRALYTLTRSLDTTRFVIDNDGWEHTEMTDLFGIHDYARSGDIFYEKYKDPNLGKPGTTVPEQWAQGNGARLQVQRLAAVPFRIRRHCFHSARDRSARRNPGDIQESRRLSKMRLTRLRGIYQAIAKVPAIMGICYTQTTDVEQEINGVMTYDRKPKYDTKVMREINDLLR